MCLLCITSCMANNQSTLSKDPFSGSISSNSGSNRLRRTRASIFPALERGALPRYFPQSDLVPFCRR